MDKKITLKLSDTMVGQILDGLHERMKVWRDTEQFMEEGYTDEKGAFIEECNDAAEARWIANYYQKIINCIEKQRDKAKTKDNKK
jgi:hypothetical protein